MKIKANYDLLAVSSLGLILIILASFLSSGIVRTVIAAPLVLFAPGYALMAAMFPRRGDLDTVKRLALSLASSLAIVTLAGLALNYSPVGVKVYPVIITLTLITMALSALAVYRRGLMKETAEFTLPRVSLKWFRKQSGIQKIKSIALALAVLGTVGFLGFMLANPRIGEGYTEFYVLSSASNIDVPMEATAGNNIQLKPVIISHEIAPVNYRLAVVLNGVVVKTFDDINLTPEQTREIPVTLNMPGAGKNEVELTLYRDRNNIPYRRLYIPIDVKLALVPTPTSNG